MTKKITRHIPTNQLQDYKKFILKANTSNHEINVLRGIVHQINWFLNNSKGK